MTAVTVTAGSVVAVSLAAGSALRLSGLGSAQIAPPGVPGSGSDTVPRSIGAGESSFGPYPVAVTINIVAATGGPGVIYSVTQRSDVNSADGQQQFTAAQAAALQGLVSGAVISFLWSGSSTASATGASTSITPTGKQSTVTLTAGTGVTALTAQVQVTNDAATAAGGGSLWTTIATIALTAAGSSALPVGLTYLGMRINITSLTGGTASAIFTPNATPLAVPNGSVVVNPTYTGIPQPTRYLLAQSGIPICKPSSGTMGANGALSGLVQNFARTFPACYLYFKAGAVYAGSPAGMYYTVMSSTTAGTVYNNVYSGIGVPTIPASPTPIVAAGPGAYTQDTAAFLLAVSIPLPGGSLGPNGKFIVRESWEIDNSATQHDIGTAFGASTEFLTLNMAVGSTPSFTVERSVCNVGVENQQVFFNPSGSALSELITSNQALKGGTVDTTQTQNIRIYAIMGAATSILCLTSWSIEVLPSA